MEVSDWEDAKAEIKSEMRPEEYLDYDSVMDLIEVADKEIERLRLERADIAELEMLLGLLRNNPYPQWGNSGYWAHLEVWADNKLRLIKGNDDDI